jgi:hypothetical protein
MASKRLTIEENAKAQKLLAVGMVVSWEEEGDKVAYGEVQEFYGKQYAIVWSLKEPGGKRGRRLQVECSFLTIINN